MRIRELYLLAAVPVVLALAGCGGANEDGVASANGGSASPSASTSASMDPEEAALKFAQCMRKHGIDMPDPKVGGGKVNIKINAKGVPRSKLQGAQKACQHFMAAGGKGPAADDPKARDQLLKFAQCMREHGIDMADPKPGQGVDLRVPKGSRAKLEAAQKACQKFQPGGVRGVTRVGGDG